MTKAGQFSCQMIYWCLEMIIGCDYTTPENTWDIDGNLNIIIHDQGF
jgi:hypothetical protein